MIDFHNHILPGADDGAKTVEESIDMFRCAEQQGITDVVNTIHFQHPKMSHINTDYNFIKSEKDKLQKTLSENNIKIKIHLGAEVFFNFNLLDILSNKLVTFCNGKYMLVEFHTLSLPKDYEIHLYKLSISGVRPIIAHPERYKPIQSDITVLENLLKFESIIQIDAGSLLGHFGEKCKETALLLLKRNMVHIIGSDAHNNRKRNFCLEPAYDIAKSILGHNAEALVKTNPQKILNGEDIEYNEIFHSKKSRIFSFKNFFKIS